MSKREKLDGNTFGDFKAIEYIGGKRYKLVCNICGEERELLATNIKKNIGVTCITKKEAIVDLTDKVIGEWHVMEYIGNKRYLCECSCGEIKDVLKVNLLNGSSTSCGHKHNTYGDITGQIFGEWEVIRKEEYRWLCKCSCGKLGYASSSDLSTGRTTSCGHGYNEFDDLTGKEYSLWEVLRYSGNGYYTCKCNCEHQTIKNVKRADLLRGASTSCGCNKANKIKETLLERYGEVGANRVSSPRTSSQILAASSHLEMKEFIQGLGYKVTSIQLAKELDINLGQTLNLLNRFNLTDMVDRLSGKSSGELEVLEFIKETTDKEIITGDRDILNGKELDIYIPELKLAIEFNGTYWHSSLLKEKEYHREKTIDCEKKGIQLIHIFEYEWNEKSKCEKIKDIIRRAMCSSEVVIYSNKIEIRKVFSKEKAREFIERYNIDNCVDSDIHIGAYYKNELIGILAVLSATNKIHRVCWKANIEVIKGEEKLIKHFIEQYSPISLTIHIDKSKFTGWEYNKIGFKASTKHTDTNYVWVSPDGKSIVSENEIQKRKLIKEDTEKEVYQAVSENDIIGSLGYLKIYDSGSLMLEWSS